MFSDLSYNTLPFDVPVFPSLPEDDALRFDDLFNISRELDFTPTISHIWPCEDEPSPLSETELEDLLASIVHTPPSEGSPLPSSPPSTTVDQDVHLQQPALAPSIPEVNASIAPDFVPLTKQDDQVLAETGAAVAPRLQGWSPPNGSQFLDLEESMMIPQSAKDDWFPPWLAALFPLSHTQPAITTDRSSPTASENGQAQPQTAETQPKPVRITDMTADENIPPAPLPVQSPSVRPTKEAARSRSTQKYKSPHTATTHRTKPSKSRSRPHLPAAPPKVATSYAKAPRGGVPPHVARSVTKANILRVEQEQKAIRDAFSGAAKGEEKKPSVLRGSATGRKETSKTVSGGGSAKKPFSASENSDREERATKRARV